MRVRILVVDDQPVIRTNLRLRLAALGCEVEEAENAIKGLEAFKKFNPHLVTLDILMPTVKAYTALDLVKDIRQSGSQADVVIISSKIQDREEFLKEGAIEFITKPFDNFAGLVRKLQPLVESLAQEHGQDKVA